MMDHLKRAELFRASLPPAEQFHVEPEPSEPAVLFPLMRKIMSSARSRDIPKVAPNG